MGLQKAAEEKFGTKPKIRTGAFGDMNVVVNGKNVFQYKKEGKVPEIPELLRRIEAAKA